MFKPLEDHEEEILNRVKTATRNEQQVRQNRHEVRWLMATARPEDFKVEYDTQGNFIFCVLERELSDGRYGYFIAVAKRNVCDTFTEKNGRRIALRRAFEQVGVCTPWRMKS